MSEATELTTMTAAQMAAAVAGGEVSAVELAQAHLDRIALTDVQVRAFLHVAADSAIAAAQAVDDRRAAGAPLGPLAGVPLVLKDVFTTSDMPTTCGSQDPGGLAAAVRRDYYQAAAGRRDCHTRQVEHGRVRDGLVHRELGLRPVA